MGGEEGLSMSMMSLMCDRTMVDALLNIFDADSRQLSTRPSNNAITRHVNPDSPDARGLACISRARYVL